MTTMAKWVEFEDQLEADQVKRYLHNETDISMEWPDRYACGTWFRWEDNRTLHLCCTKDSLGEPWADLVLRELCKRFRVTRIGQDELGWFDPICPKMLPGYSWIDWLRFQGASDLLEPFVLEGLSLSAGQLADQMERDIKALFVHFDHRPAIAMETADPVLEAELLFNREGKTFYWHLPETRTKSYIPGTWEVWQAMWENRHRMGGMAHTHPFHGEPWYSQEDVTTWSACDLGLGRRMVWVVVTLDQVGYYQWKGPGKYDYGIIQPEFGVEDIAELRRRSIVAG